MVSVYDFKPRFQQMLMPVYRLMVTYHVMPNQVTLWALFLSAAGGGVIYLGHQYRWFLLAVPLVLVLRMALNALDGMLARNLSLSTPLGEVLNEVGDVVSDLLLYAPLLVYVHGSLKSTVLLVAFLLLGVLAEFCGVLAKALSGRRRYDGPMGKSDRALLVGLYCLMLLLWPSLTVGTPVLFGLANVLLVTCCIARLNGALEDAAARQQAEAQAP